MNIQKILPKALKKVQSVKNALTAPLNEAHPEVFKTSLSVASKAQYSMGTALLHKRSMGLFDLSSDILAKSSKIEVIEEIAPDKLIMCHLTDFLPVGGKISTTYDASGFPRNTLHFALNHSVANPLGGGGPKGWTEKRYGILIPFKNGLKSFEDKCFGGRYNDFIIEGSINLPEGSFIIAKNPEIPFGKAFFSDASSKIQELQGVKGITLVETSMETYDAVDLMVEKLGFTNLKTLHAKMVGMNPEFANMSNDMEAMQKQAQSLMEPDFDFDKYMESIGLKDFSPEDCLRANECWNEAWQAFCTRLNFENCNHSDTIFSRFEKFIETLAALVYTKTPWNQGEKDYKLILSECLDVIKKSKNPDKTLFFNPSEVQNIIKKSKTPSIASNLLYKELGIATVPDISAAKKLSNSDWQAILDKYLPTLTDPIESDGFFWNY